VKEHPTTTWRAISRNLREGRRRLPGGSSLAQLLYQHRGVRHRFRLPKLTLRQILKWADAHRRRTGRWPSTQSGHVADAPGETWHSIQHALIVGRRGLPGGLTLAKTLARYRGKPNHRATRLK
jgi:hypothetical protein